MTSDSKICPTCGKSAVADPANPGAACAGHSQAAGAFAGPGAEGGGQNLKAALDAIKSPGAAAASPSPASAAKPVPPPVPAPAKPSSSQHNIKSALDSIPTPGAAKPAPAQSSPAPAASAAPVSGADLKAQLDAIGSPAAKAPAPTATAPAAPDVIDLSALNSIPTPGTSAPSPAAPAPVAASPSGIDLSALNSIPTPGIAAPSGPGASTDGIDPNIRNMMNELNSIPSPAIGGSASGPQPVPADAPQWMKNYAQYQSSITSSPDKPFNAPESYTPSNRNAPNTSSGYMMIAVLVIVLIGGFFAYVSINKPAPVQFTEGSTASPSTPSATPASPSYAESTPISPSSSNYTPPAQTPATNTP